MTADGSRWAGDDRVERGADYDRRWERLAAQGESVHGEAEFVLGFEPASVLDAGCGTGRVAIELARRGVDVVGVDLDPPMVAQARAKAPDLAWIEADLARYETDREFDVVVMAGNVMIFVEPGTESAVVANLGTAVAPGGSLIAGFELGRGYALEDYDAHCRSAGLELADRFASWDAAIFEIDSTYAVSVHVRPL